MPRKKALETSRNSGSKSSGSMSSLSWIVALKSMWSVHGLHTPAKDGKARRIPNLLQLIVIIKTCGQNVRPEPRPFSLCVCIKLDSRIRRTPFFRSALSSLLRCYDILRVKHGHTTHQTGSHILCSCTQLDMSNSQHLSCCFRLLTHQGSLERSI